MKKLFILFAAFLMFEIAAKADKIQLDSLWQMNFDTTITITVKFSPNGKYIGLIHWLDEWHRDEYQRLDTTIILKPLLIDRATGKVIREFSGINAEINSFDFSPDGSLIAAGGDYIKDSLKVQDSLKVCIWNVETGNLERTLLVNDSNLKYYQFVDQVIFSPNGQKLFIRTHGQNYIPDYPPHYENLSKLVAYNTQTWQVDRYKEGFHWDIRISPDNRFYALKSSGGRYVNLYDLNSDSLVHKFNQEGYLLYDLYWFDFSPDSSKIAIADAGIIRIYNLNTYAQVDSIVFSDSLKYIEPIKYFPNSRYLFLGNLSWLPNVDLMKIFDLQTREFIYQDSNTHREVDITKNSNYFLRINPRLIRLDSISYTPKTKVKENEDENNKNNFIYPNPVSDYLISNLPENRELLNIQIFSALGIKLIETEYNERIDVSSLAPGVYFVKVGDRVGKFVKM